MNDSKIYKIGWQTSLILDILRLSAAIVVFIFHVYIKWFNNAFIHKLAHFSVIVFFVLSGYLIAYTTTNNNRGAIQYARARLSKLYSVLLPAIIITAICEIIVYFVNPAIHDQYTRSPILIRYFVSTFFLNEVWSFSAAPPMNSPLWSLSYEFWYYVIFGVWFYFKKLPQSYIIILIPVIIAGPSILLLFPIWLMGSLAYKLPHLSKSSFPTSWKIFFAAMVVAVIALLFMPGLPYDLGFSPLFFANQFITDNVLGFILAIALSAITKIKSNRQEPSGIKIFRKIADFTFPLYLLHYPLLILWLSLFPPQMGNGLQFMLALICILPMVIIIGLLIESRSYWWDNFFNQQLYRVNRFMNLAVFKIDKNSIFRTGKKND